MNVKGIVYLTGKTNLIEAFGEERWNSFIPKLTAKDKFFSNVIMSVTPIPVEKFILYLDEMIKEYFNNDMMQYVTIGKAAAKFAVSPEGPYKSYPVSYTHLRAHETVLDLVCRLLLEK